MGADMAGNNSYHSSSSMPGPFFMAQSKKSTSPAVVN